MVNRQYISVALREHLALSILQDLLFRSTGSRFEPALEVLHADHMLNLGMLYFNSDRGLTVPDVLNPIIVAENPQSLGYRLVDAAGTNFNRMFDFLKIETGDFARLQRHQDDLSFSFLLRQSSSETLQIRNQDKREADN